MDNRPIGFFDSGLGGLTCIPHILRKLPEEDIIFFGDTARTPYGSKTKATIKAFSLQVADFLLKNHVKMIVVACNTVSATCLSELREAFPNVPIIGVISPTAQVVKKTCKPSEHIGIIGTKATITSNDYENKINEESPGLELYSLACPAFVPLIEEGLVDHRIMDMTIRYYLDDFIEENSIDTLVLGCTHYHLLSDNLKRLYPDIKVINASEEVAVAVKMELEKRDMLAEDNVHQNTFYASDLSENYVNMIQNILERETDELNIQFKRLEL